MAEPHFLTLPDYWASYLINGEKEGLSAAELAHIDSYLAGLGVSPSWFVDVGEPYFTRSYASFSGDSSCSGIFVTSGHVATYTYLT